MKWIGIAALAVLLGVLSVGNHVGAADWSWSGGPVGLYKQEFTDFQDDKCPTYSQHIDVAGYGMKIACMFGGSVYQFARTKGNHNQPMLVARHQHDTGFRQVKGVCEQLHDCRYGANDWLTERQYMPGLYQRLVGYANISQRLEVTDGGAAYRLSSADPDLVIRAKGGEDLAVGAHAYSNNGEWLVLELANHGIAVVDLATQAIKRIVPWGYQYFMAMDPVHELAISNDGRSVVVTGLNGGLSFYQITNECGEEPQLPLTQHFSTDAKLCDQVSIDPSQYVSGFRSGHRPRFDNSGGELRLTLQTVMGMASRVTLHAAGYVNAPGMTYLALGDSFTSGEGEDGDEHYRVGTNQAHERCHVSTRSYPYLIGEFLEVIGRGTVSVACAGAKVTDVIGNEEGYLGQGGRLGIGGLALPERDLAQFRIAALEGFIPGRLQQKKFIEEYRPRVVTIGVGGNDAGLMAKLKVCAMPGTCEWAASEEGKKKSLLEVHALYDSLVTMYRELRQLAPETDFYAVGYPLVIDPDGGCDTITGLLLDRDERLYMRDSLLQLNAVIQSASMAAGVSFISTEDSFMGHRLCEQADEHAMNGLRLGDDIALIEQLDMTKVIGSESFHPTSFGHQLLASVIGIVVRQARTPECGECFAILPPRMFDPVVSEALAANTPLQIQEVLVRQPRITGQQKLMIHLPAGSLKAGSTARLHIGATNSTAEVIVAADGGLVHELQVAEELRAGYYTVHVEGVLPVNKPVDFYQVFEVSAEQENANAGSENEDPKIDSAPVGEILSAGEDSNNPIASPESTPKVTTGEEIEHTDNAPIDAAVLGATDEKSGAKVEGFSFNWLHVFGVVCVVVGIASIIIAGFYWRRRYR